MMCRSSKRVGKKKFPVRGSSTPSEADKITYLQYAGIYHYCIVNIPTENAVALTSENRVGVYSLDKLESEAMVVFLEHEGKVYDAMNVSGDILVSVAEDGKMITWHSSTGNVIDKLELGGKLRAVVKLDDTRIAVGNWDGDLIVVAHNHGTELREIHRISNAHSEPILSMAVDDKTMVAASLRESITVWDTSNYQRLATFKFDDPVCSVAICAAYIAVAGYRNNIDMYENGTNFKLHCTLTTDEHWIDTLTFIGSDTLMVGGHSSISFISVSRRHYISRVHKLDNETRYNVQAQVVRDGRIAVIGYKRAAIISAPSQVEQQLAQYASEQYSSLSALAAPTLAPLQSAWNAVNDGTLDILDACELIKPDNCSVSIDEWTFGHHLLMQGISDGVIPKRLHYKGIQRYWLQNLYKVCTSLVIGDKDIDLILRFLRQAVAACVIGEWASDYFIHRVETRKDFAVGERKLVHAVWVLFMQQAEMDERLQRVIRYQQEQQLFSFITAILGCVPLAGSIVTKVVDEKAVIPNNFDVHGLVESLLGIGKDMSTFGTEPLVDRFLRGSAELLSEEKWWKVPVEKQKGVKDAAESLGMSLSELRDKLCMACNEPSPQITEVTVVETFDDHDGVTEKPDVVTGLRETGPRAVAASSLITISPSEGAITSGDDARAELQAELAGWKERGLDKQSIERFNTEQVAVCVAAYLVNYNEKRIMQFEEFKTTLMNAFHDGLIEGRTFASAVTSHRKVAAAVALDAISEMCDEKLVRGTKVALEQFLRDLHRAPWC